MQCPVAGGTANKCLYDTPPLIAGSDVPRRFGLTAALAIGRGRFIDSRLGFQLLSQ